MKKTLLLSFLTGTVWLTFETFTVISNGSNPPLGKTGGTNEGLCTDCHSDNALNSGAAQVKCDFIFNGSVDSFYNPNNGPGSYQISATLAEKGSEASGFEMTMLDSKGKGVGDFTPNNTSKTAATISGGKPYFYHTKKDNPNPGGNDWQASWNPPSVSAGTITLFTAINGSDNDGSDNGDFIYTLKSVIKIDPNYNGVTWQKNNAMKLAVFPTTVSDNVNVSYNNTHDQQIVIDLIDMKGNVVKNLFNASQHQGENNLSFDLSGTAQGMYFVRMQAGQQEVSKKVFIL